MTRNGFRGDRVEDDDEKLNFALRNSTSPEAYNFPLSCTSLLSGQDDDTTNETMIFDDIFIASSMPIRLRYEFNAPKNP